ncbi:MAG: hypothetical protein GZ094_05320 [Mariniphaga sp.]|nr:hypothetical protein [Mariniphaga sp.]
MHNISVLIVWDAKVEDDPVHSADCGGVAAFGSEMDACVSNRQLINQESNSGFILIKVLLIYCFILIKMYFQMTGVCWKSISSATVFLTSVGYFIRAFKPEMIKYLVFIPA